mgnify:CR=1 FL=1
MDKEMKIADLEAAIGAILFSPGRGTEAYRSGNGAG